MAAIQAVIFLILVLLVWVFDLTIGLRDIRAAGLDMRLSDERFVSSEAAAASLREYHAGRIAQDEMVSWLELPMFNVKRLDMVKETMPPGVELIQLDIDELGAVLTFQTANLSLVDIHREAWLSTGLVSRVQLASASSVEEERIRYILNLHWNNES